MDLDSCTGTNGTLALFREGERFEFSEGLLAIARIKKKQSNADRLSCCLWLVVVAAAAERAVTFVNGTFE